MTTKPLRVDARGNDYEAGRADRAAGTPDPNRWAGSVDYRRGFEHERVAQIRAHAARPPRHHLYDLVTTIDADARLVTSKHPDVRVCELEADTLVCIRRVRTHH